MEPKISIIIASYNYSQFLEQSITSALNQTRYPDEILIIDDASTDQSPEIIRKFENTRNLTCIYRELNKGILYNINDGLKRAKGDFIFFLSADDFIEPDLLKEYLPHLNLHPEVGFCCSQSYKMNLNTGNLTLCSHQAPLSEGYITPQEAEKIVYKHGEWFSGNTILLNRKKALKEGGFDASLYSYTDGFLYLRLALKYGLINLNKPLSTYRSHDNSFSSQIWSNTTRLADIENRVVQVMREQPNLFKPKFIHRWQCRWTFMKRLSYIFVNKDALKAYKFFVAVIYFLTYRWFDLINIRLIDINTFLRRIRS